MSAHPWVGGSVDGASREKPSGRLGNGADHKEVTPKEGRAWLSPFLGMSLDSSLTRAGGVWVLPFCFKALDGFLVRGAMWEASPSFDKD